MLLAAIVQNNACTAPAPILIGLLQLVGDGHDEAPDGSEAAPLYVDDEDDEEPDDDPPD